MSTRGSVFGANYPFGWISFQCKSTLAVLLVLAGHFSHSGLTFGIDLGGAGTIGVYCFFVLSSFLLATPLIRRGAAGLTDRMVWLNYATRRVLRIYPLYVTILIFYQALSTFNLAKPEAGLYFEGADLLKHLILVDAKEYLWTIQVETKFYLILPLLVFVIVTMLRVKPVSVLLAGGVGMVISVMVLDGEEDRGSLLLQLPVFLSGVMGASLFCSLGDVKWFSSSKQVADIVAVILLMLIISLLPTLSGFVYDGDVDASVLKKPYLFGILWTSFLLCVLYGRGVVNKILELKFLRFTGIVSFSMYLWHVPVLAVIKRMPIIDGLLGLLVALTVIYIVSSVSYLYIEKPFLKIEISSKKTAIK